MVKLQRTTYEKVIQNFSHRGTKQARQQVWNFINAMPTLYFVQCGRQTCPVPWILFEDDSPLAMVFTSYEHAVETARATVEDTHLRIVGLPTNAAAMYVTALAAQGIEQVCFNHGPNRFDASMHEVIEALRALHR